MDTKFCRCGQPQDKWYSNRCRTCRNIYQSAYHYKHKKKAQEYQREYRLTHHIHKSTKKEPIQIDLLKDRSFITQSALMLLTGKPFERACQAILNGEKKIPGFSH